MLKEKMKILDKNQDIHVILIVGCGTKYYGTNY